MHGANRSNGIQERKGGKTVEAIGKDRYEDRDKERLDIRQGAEPPAEKRRGWESKGVRLRAPASAGNPPWKDGCQRGKLTLAKGLKS